MRVTLKTVATALLYVALPCLAAVAETGVPTQPGSASEGILPDLAASEATTAEDVGERLSLAGYEKSAGCLEGCAGKGIGGHCGCRLLGLVAPSDTCFSDFISPMTNPVFFEDPRTLTEARLIYLRQRVPITAGGGDVNLIAMHVRAALNDRLSIIATKDGYATSSNDFIDDGWADVAAGLKYNLFADHERRRLLSGGVVFELPVGSTRTLQGNGDGLFDIFLTGGAEINGWHVLSGTGFLLPADSSAESQMWYWSNHIDRRIGCTNLYLLGEANWYHWMRSGKVGLNGVEGGDLFNLGSRGVAGNDIVTGALGMKYKPHHRMEVGVAWEAPLTKRRDVMDNRLTFDFILRY